MIVEALPIHAAFFADFRDIDLGKGLLHEFFQWATKARFVIFESAIAMVSTPTKN